jgi:hypothetical protein
MKHAQPHTARTQDLWLPEGCSRAGGCHCCLLQKYEKLCQQSEQERQQLQRQNEALQSRVRSSTSGPSDKENMRVAKRVQG